MMNLRLEWNMPIKNLLKKAFGILEMNEVCAYINTEIVLISNTMPLLLLSRPVIRPVLSKQQYFDVDKT
jgi:hypothetical protein